MSAMIIDTPARLTTFLDNLPDCKSQPPCLYMDLEGNNLSRDGTLSLITVLVVPQEKIYLVDVTILKEEAFTTLSGDSITLKDILEDNNTPKVFFDIRNDSSALFWLYGIRVQGIEDLQLYEFASRTFQKRCVNGLARCIERDSGLGLEEKKRWQKVKDEGRKLFAPEMGGSFAVFDERPLSPAMEEYCTQDVKHMPSLRKTYLNKLCDAWWVKIAEETRERIRLSQSATFNGKGKHMAMGPAVWAGWKPRVHERRTRTLFVSEHAPVAAGPASVEPSQTAEEDDMHNRFVSLGF